MWKPTAPARRSATRSRCVRWHRHWAPGRDTQTPLLVGSVKTNIGHLESAAGIAGVIKTVLSLQHEHLPPHLHFSDPSPHIPWAEYPVRVTAAGQAWPRGAVPRRAGVSSFGFSGTNAHVILEEAPALNPPPSAQERPLHVLPLSARTPQALRTLAMRMADVLARGDATLAQVARTAGVGRSHFSERLAVVAETAATAGEALHAFARGEAHDALHTGQALPGQAPDTVFLFTGQGSQYPGMGARLYALAPVFRAAIDECHAILGADAAGRSLAAVLFDASPDNTAIHETAWTQPALFALEYALAQQWRAWGVEPAAVIGHSAGEYVAACVAGVFELRDGLRLVAERGRLMQALPPGGAMAALYCPADDVARAVATHGDRVAVAAWNAPDSVVISGDVDVVDAVLADFAERNVQGQRLFVSLAAHSPRVAPAMAPLAARAAQVPMQAPRLPVAWNVTGGPLDAAAPDARYWQRHLREPVRFGAGIAWLHAEGYRHFLEVGPHPVLCALAQRTLPDSGVHLTGSLRRGRDDWHELMHAVADRYVCGAAIDWAAVAAPGAPQRVPLPTYPFERRRYWIDAVRPMTQLARAPAACSLFTGARLATAVPTFELTLSADHPAWLAGHSVHGLPLVAGPVFLELAQAAAQAAFGAAPRRITDTTVHAPLVLSDGGRIVQTHVSADGDGWRFEVHSCAVAAAGNWQRHASGRLWPAGAGGDAPAPAALRVRLDRATSCADHYERLARLGIVLDSSWQSLSRAHVLASDVVAQLALPAGLNANDAVWVHPALLDGALQAVGMALAEASDGDEMFLLTGLDAVQIDAPLPASVWCHARLHATDAHAVERRGDVSLFAEDGRSVGVITGVALRRAPRESLTGAAETSAVAGLGYRVEWEPAAARRPAAPRLVPPATYVGTIAGRFEALAREHGTAVYEELLPELDALAARYVASALATLGFIATPRRRFAADTEALRLGVVPRHRRLFARLLQMLVEDGVLRADGAEFVCERVQAASAPDAHHDTLLRRFGAVDAELSVLRRCGSELARVLRGEQDALQLLFPGGSLAEARKLYVESPFARTYNGALADTVSAAIAQLPADAHVRVLEIGAGTGGTTGYVLPRLPAQRTEYTFTDVSPLFLERAATQFAAFPGLERRLLDIERDPTIQGFECGRYDIVIAANVLHACTDLAQAVQHARSLLAPGGLLLLLEGMAPERWVDLSFGLTDGWWRFADAALRPDYPLIGRTAWQTLLEQQGFECTVLPSAGAARGTNQQALIVARAPQRARRYTLVGGPAELVAALGERLRSRGDTVVCSAIDDSTAAPASDHWVYLGALDVGDGSDDHQAARCAALAVQQPLRGLARLVGDAHAGRAWLITRGAHRVRAAAAVDGRWQAPLWGLARVFALEQPTRWGGAIDLPPDGDAIALAQTLITAIDADDGEDQTAWRGGERFACRLLPAALPDHAAPRLRDDATYLVSGGFGGLGLLVARWLVERGARHVALLGRRPDMSAPGVRALQAMGAQVIALAGNVADGAAMAALLAQVEREAPAVRGVLHLAADLSAAPLTELSAEQLDTMLRPKLHGTLVLERLARSRRMDFLVLFSSTTALLGAAGLAHYAAANAFLDATAEHTRDASCPVLSVSWGTWASMRLASSDSQQSFRHAGLEPMRDAAALDALGRLMAAGSTRGIVAAVDWARLKPVHEARRARPFLRHLGTRVASTDSLAAEVAAGPSALVRRLASAPPALRHDLLIEHVQGEVAAVLALPDATTVAPAVGLFDLGMDSLMAVELKRRLERAVGHALPSTLTFNYPNVCALAGFLDAQMAATATPTVTETPRAPRMPADEARPLAELNDDELERRLLARLHEVG